MYHLRALCRRLCAAAANLLNGGRRSRAARTKRETCTCLHSEDERVGQAGKEALASGYCRKAQLREARDVLRAHGCTAPAPGREP